MPDAHADQANSRSNAAGKAPTTSPSADGDKQNVPSGSGRFASGSQPHVDNGDREEVTLAKAVNELVRPLARFLNALVERPGLRLALVGAALVVAAFELGAGSALSVPLLVVGLVMLVVGALGSRLRGRFAVDFGPAGAVVEARAEIAPSRRSTPAPSPSARPQITLVTPSSSEDSSAEDVIEGHGETIEMDVAQLKRLLAAERVDTAGG